jgi:RNA polymerase primary sigma factor
MLQPGRQLEAAELTTSIEDALGSLTSIEADVIRRRFGLDGPPPQTLREVGEEHGYSKERIRQIQERALGRLRGRLSRSGFATLASVDGPGGT